MADPLDNRPSGIGLFALKATFSQADDCVDGDGLGQHIDVEVANGGGGPFIVLSTPRWSLDAANAGWLKDVIESMCARCADAFGDEENPDD